MDDLPSEYDVIVIGTGMTESIVAAAASRVGKRVLHLDCNEYYGGMWAAFNFDGLQKWLAECQNKSSELEHESTDNLLKEGESLVKAGSQFATVFNIEEKWLIPEVLQEKDGEPQPSKDTQTEGNCDLAKEEHEGGLEKGEKESSESEKDKDSSQSKCWSQNKLKTLYRKFNLDLAPKLLYARGSLVELLISSNIARYAEFRSVSRVLTYINDKLETVPCSRADVFSTKEISVVEKRMLMQLLTLCHEYAKDPDNKEFQGFENKTFVEYLDSKKLTTNLRHYVLYAIAMSTNSTPCMEGVERTQRFLTSLGRYGNTPFLWPMYGSGELPQCFCRLCAVFGGVYHLKRAANSVIVAQGGEGGPHCAGIVSGSQRLTTQHLVIAVSDAPKSFLKSAPTGGLSRGIFITDRSILTGSKESLTLLQFPPQDGNGELVTVIEVGPSTNACPSGLFVVHMTCRQVKSAREDLASAVSTLLHTEPCEGVYRSDTQSQASQKNDEDKDVEGTDISQAVIQPVKPQLLWSLYFNCPETSSCDLSADVPSNVHLCSGPDLDLDFEVAVKQAKDIFKKMYPDCEFLPRAPDPEEIVLDDDTEPGPAFIDNKAESDTPAPAE
ncbi:rab proteins geranylgeranyltransferase component A-like [Macrosteles quadrilineatus]|uniref:rab proteins geranylgeranyltransferase component A-like n=1 Tax=Macrosteles quadrilineatus TaxID=74068 RepID=UPI0023E33C44|nr:rab proteins geranylgeranyltransferase component A-like [Macrosteles quadrilineatus]XP_054262571.1 rab proteins geranylgeranyltransferase component A-like [Macrosteles quadrilineatus]